MFTQEQFDLYKTTLNRIKLTRKAAEGMESFPEYTLWQILARYDEACGGKKDGKEWRYKIMYWLFQGKWKPSDEVSGNDLTASEVHVMARWSDPSRKAEFEKEIKAVMAVLGHNPEETPLTDHILTPAPGITLIDENLSPQEQKDLFCKQLGVHKYKMGCGHLNDDYTSYGHPVCSRCMNASREERDNTLFEKSLVIADELDW